MSELDRIKEQLAYLKFWQGIMVVTDISLVGWLVSAADTARPLPIALAVVGVVSLTVGIVIVHRHIERRIDQIGKL
jgi:xanthosine utilization system XapX-like protein